jgi:site-specific recombinase XerC
VGSIQRRLNAIAEAHKAMAVDSPTAAGIVRNTLKGIRRTLGTAAVQKAPALTADIRAMVEASDAGLIGARDRAIVLLGFAGAFRRAEIVGLDVADLAFSRDGLTVTLRRSKTDQEAQGRKIGIPYGSNPETCPVRTLQGWLTQAGLAEGAARWAGRGQVCGTQLEVRARHKRGRVGSLGAFHHEPDWPSVGADGAAVHSRRQFV